MKSLVALESTLLLHGVPRAGALELAKRLFSIIEGQGAAPRLITIQAGVPHVQTTALELEGLLQFPPSEIPKVNSANLGAALHLGWNAATTVSSTMELAALEGIQYFATGGLGGVHPLKLHAGSLALDVSSDLSAFTRFPVAVVASGVKSILDVAATREMLEALGVTVVGFQTNKFPAFYFRSDPGGKELAVDVRFDDVVKLSRFVKAEMSRTGRGLLITNPIAAEAELKVDLWNLWLAAAEALPEVGTSQGRNRTPRLLEALHRLSGGATLAANVRLIEDNVRLAAKLAACAG